MCRNNKSCIGIALQYACPKRAKRLADFVMISETLQGLCEMQDFFSRRA